MQQSRLEVSHIVELESEAQLTTEFRRSVVKPLFLLVM
jgi:hypothetical protein